MKDQYSFDDIQKAFVNGSISLTNFASILADNFGKKKARKILRQNLEPQLKKEGLSFEERQEYLELISLIV